MISHIISYLASFIISVIDTTGYAGIVFLMALESACVPVPSEIIMPFSGFLVAQGHFNIWIVGFLGAAGNLIGSIVAYLVGFYGGRPFVEKYGKYFLFSHRDLDLADRWFAKHGQGTVFFSRLLPVVRTFISLPAGIARMNFKKFCFYTFVGCLPWSYALTYAGIVLGHNWADIRIYFEKFEIIIGILIAAFIIWWIRRHVKCVCKITEAYD